MVLIIEKMEEEKSATRNRQGFEIFFSLFIFIFKFSGREIIV